MKRYLFTLILASCGIAQAATVNFTITLGDIVPTSAGLTPHQFIQGSVSYNSSLVPLTGAFTLTPATDPTLTVDLNFAGSLYHALDDTDPLFPQFGFIDGEIRAISYWAANKHPGSTEDGFIQIEGNLNRFTYSFDGDDEFFGTVTWPFQAIPEPHTALLLAAAALLMHRRQRPHWT
jgi:hypothetical protein